MVWPGRRDGTDSLKFHFLGLERRKGVGELGR